MGITERKERERSELRRTILDAARELFVQEGYEAVTMRRLAERIEYSPPTLYLYFKDKDALLRELCLEDMIALRAAFEKALTAADSVGRIRALGEAYVEFALEFPNHYKLMFVRENPSNKPEPGDAFDQMRGDPNQDAYALLRYTVQQAIDEGAFLPGLSDVDLIAQVLWGGLHGMIMLHFQHQFDEWLDWKPIESTMNLMATCMLRGMLRDPERAESARPAAGGH